MTLPLPALLTTLVAALVLASCRRQPSATDLEAPAKCNRVPITYESDGLRIRGLVSKPEGAGPFPILIVNHGGFDPAEKVAAFADFFATAGFLALAPDYRGCGKSAGKHELAKGEVNDVLNAMRYAQRLHCADAKRVYFFGFSHGAALSLLAAAREPAIQGVIAVQGPTDLAECYAHWVAHRAEPGIAPLAGLHLIVGGTPEQHPAAWRERSPLFVAAAIHCPVLLIYSDADAAVPPSQGLRMHEALLSSSNTQVSLIMLPGLNHGLTPAAWMELRTPMLDFLKHPPPP